MLQGRARQLYASGLHTLQQVAHADPRKLVSTIEHLSLRTAHQIVLTAQVGTISLLSFESDLLIRDIYSNVDI